MYLRWFFLLLVMFLMCTCDWSWHAKPRIGLDLVRLPINPAVHVVNRFLTVTLMSFMLLGIVGFRVPGYDYYITWLLSSRRLS
jgi:hypothetical protein